jgi:Mg-chelatase subunit ChlD
MRTLVTFIVAAIACGFASVALAQQAETGLQIEIQSPAPDFTANEGEVVVEVEGIASAIGGVRYLDMVFVMDTSHSLRSSDPEDYRSQGAAGLVRNLSPRSDIQVGVVSFDNKGNVAQPLTPDRQAAVDAILGLPKSGSTNIAAGIETALRELRQNGRPGSSRVIMLFTDGMSNEKLAYEAAVKAHAHGVVVQSLLLGSNNRGTSILDTVAWATGGSFIKVSDPTELPQAFLDMRTTGVDSVLLSVNGSVPVAAKLAGGTFSGELPLAVGENTIVAYAQSLDGDTRQATVVVNVRDASCAALEVNAIKQGRPVSSLDDKSVQIVVDASRSMWGQIQGEAKMSIAKNILNDVSYWYPEDLDLALRAYGNVSPSESNNCSDSTLLVPFYEQNRAPIRAAIAGLKPTGQTPIAFALNQAAQDFGSLNGDRAVVLVTDGIESCGGNPVQAARTLGAQGIKVHVIGFGLGNVTDEDAASLQSIADASGGRYVFAGSAEELIHALSQTVATPFSVFKGGIEVSSGVLGSSDTILLPEGDYRVEVYSEPPHSVPVALESRDRVAVTLEKRGDRVAHLEKRERIEHRSCEQVAARIERLENRSASLETN